MIWRDIVVLGDAREAHRAIQALVARLTTPAEAAEIVGARFIREISAGGWRDPIIGALLDPWRERVCKHAFLRWETAARQRLVEDTLHAAAERLEAAAAKAGVRLGRSGRDALRDAIRAEVMAAFDPTNHV